MPTRETHTQRAAHRAMTILRRVGEDLRVARATAGMSTRLVGGLAGISHTQVIRIERGLAPHVDIYVLARMASVLGHELSLRIHPIASAVRDAAHVALLDRFPRRLGRTIRWRTEVPVPVPGDLRSADGVVWADDFDAIVEAETRLLDVQAAERRLRSKQNDLGATRRSCWSPTSGTTVPSSRTCPTCAPSSRSGPEPASRRSPGARTREETAW